MLFIQICHLYGVRAVVRRPSCLNFVEQLKCRKNGEFICSTAHLVYAVYLVYVMRNTKMGDHPGGGRVIIISEVRYVPT